MAAQEPGVQSRQPGGQARRVDFDPVSRVAGPLAVRTTVDLDGGQVLEAAAMATHFRGYEVVLEGRDPRDAIFVSSRACGVCGGVHATCSALALEMAFGIQPPPMGILGRNLLVALEYLYDLSIQLFVRAGPDYSEPVVRDTNPELWTRAESTAAPGVAIHGFARIADIMTAMTRFTGQLHAEALQLSRAAREAYVLIGGKYPHPQTIVPGGLSTKINRSSVNHMFLRAAPFLDYGQKVVAIWDDLTDFFYEADPRFLEVGMSRKNFIDLGQWDDPFAYDGTYQNAAAWGELRWATPGAIIDGRLRTTNLHQLGNGVEEFVEHSFYDDWSGAGDHGVQTDPLGNRLSPNHPWSKQTLPRPAGTSSRGKYSWSTAPRWERNVVDTGAYSRLWVTALAKRQPHQRFVESTGHSLRMSVPKGELPGVEVEWHAPETWNTFERNRARAYGLLHCALVAYEHNVIALDLLRKGGPDSKVSTPYRIPKDFRVGAGLWGGARGYLSHHLTMDDGVIQSYQIVAPSTFTASPMDSLGNRGPLEEAITATPLLSSSQPERCVDVLRTIRSFDPCMSCSSH